MNEMIMRLIEEETLPEEMFLEDIMEETIDTVEEIITGIAESDDFIIDTIASGGIKCENAIDFSDDVIYAALDDDDDLE